MKRKPAICSALVMMAALLPAAVSVVAADEEPAASAPKNEVACDQLPFSIQLTVKNVKSSAGLITVDLHGDAPDKWLKKGGRVGRARVPAMEGQTIICIPVDHAGTYAFALYHDRDANLKLNKNWLGLPSEPYAVSNNAPIRLGPPSFKDAALQVPGPQTAATATLSN